MMQQLWPRSVAPSLTLVPMPASNPISRPVTPVLGSTTTGAPGSPSVDIVTSRAVELSTKGELVRVPKVGLKTVPPLPNVDGTTMGTLRVTDSEVRYDVDEEIIFSLPIKYIYSASSKKSTTEFFLITNGFRLIVFTFLDQPGARKIVSRILKEELARPGASFVPWGPAIASSSPIISGGAVTNPSPVPPPWYYDLSSAYIHMGALDYGWRLTHCNTDYSLCSSYPRVLCVPSRIDDDTLRAASKYRTQNRVPILAYFYRRTRRALCRSAQPMPGMMNSEDKNDQRVVQCIGDNVSIVDLRPYVNAVGNLVTGAGYEDVRQYEGSSISFHNIPNIHKMMELYRQLLTALTDPVGPPEKETEALRIAHAAWVDALSQILTCAAHVVDVIARKQSDCLVHCSDGWDRTPQVCSLAQILLDGHSRTVEGFLQLVDKDWVQGGHHFESRLGISGRGPDRETSPVFLQFLDSVHQIMLQHPSYFEFTPRLLIHIADIMYECRYVTFCHDSAKDLHEDMELHSASTPPCAFREIMRVAKKFADPSYDPETSETVLEPCTASPALSPWRAYFHRYGKYAVRTKEVVRESQQRHSPRSVSIRFSKATANSRETRDALVQTDPSPLQNTPVIVQTRSLAHAQKMCCSADMLLRLEDDSDW